MYSEFVQGTGCKDNEKNYEVFKNLEVMYMNTNMTKEQIYEYGKKLVDNSKSEEEIRIENQIKDEIESLKNDIEWLRHEKVRYEEYVAIEEKGSYYRKLWKGEVKRLGKEIAAARNKISLLKTVLA